MAFLKTMDLLAQILDHKRQEVAAGKKQHPDWTAQLAAAEPPKPFASALLNAHENGRLPVIAEIKKQSPSRGVLSKNFNPHAIAAAYDINKAACLSVLTDSKYFGGSNDDLQQAAAGCGNRLPILRKDFIVDRWQIEQARAIGADAILLIVAALPHSTLLEFCQAGLGLGMAVLVEVHNSEEMQTALATPRQALIGINNRDLKTFKTDSQTSHRLLPTALQHGRYVVAESGIHHADDVRQLQAAGACGFLIGEALMHDPTRLPALFA